MEGVNNHRQQHRQQQILDVAGILKIFVVPTEACACSINNASKRSTVGGCSSFLSINTNVNPGCAQQRVTPIVIPHFIDGIVY